jgi:hypothetical protein
VQAQQYTTDIFNKQQKPYKFLFLNGRARPHRKYLLERFKQLELLDQSIWTMLDGRGSGNRYFNLVENGVDLVTQNTPITHLPSQYEFKFFKNNSIARDYPHKFGKHELFNNVWGDIYLEPAPYIDTYFSLVTETVFEYPYSFRTEKIAKPLMMGHPWICATNVGFYQDIQNLGFRTFNHVIDESFDQIENHQDRMERIAMIVKDLCNSDLDSFIQECYTVCRHNQDHLLDVMTQTRSEFPQRFIDFLKQHERL